MSEKIVLIDGHSLLNRAFYGLPDLTNSEGLHTNAVYGFLNILLRILDEEKPEYLAVAFDVHAKTFRHKMYEAYKGTRKGMPEELKEQVPLTQEMMRAMGIPLMMLEGFEADDLIGTVSLQCEQAGMQVSIISGDRDLLQLASDKVCVRIPKTKRTGTEIENYFTQDVIDKYMVPPAGIVDLKALMGDASDNIPGIPGVGEKTAGKIIAAYGTIENAYAHVDEITPKRAQTSLRENYELAQLSKKLAAIDRHSPFTLNLEEAKLNNLFTAEALNLCRRLEFKNLLSRFETAEEPAGLQESVFETGSLQQAEEWIRIHAGKPVGLAFLRTEDSSRNVLAAAVCVQSDDEAAVMFFAPEEQLPEDNPFEEGDEPTASDGTEYILRAAELAAEGASAICMLDVKADRDLLESIPADRFFDAGVAAYLLNPIKGSYPYDDLAREFLGENLPAREELTGKKMPSDILLRSREGAVRKVSLEARTALLCREVMLEQLQACGMLQLYNEVEMPLVFTLYDMQKSGIRVQSEELKSYGVRLGLRIQELETAIYEQAGRNFNINSPKQLGEVLFEEMHLPFGKKTKTGYSTAADVLDKLAPDYPFVADILEYRQLTKLRSTYAEGLYAFIAADGRIHGTFNQTVTATGRISSTDPNLQNIPVRTELGRQLRKIFIPRDGYVFIDADYSQIELRVLANASGDEKLIAAYQEADDIHAITASQVFHVPLEEVTPQLRRNAKAVNFGIVYGQSSFGLSQGLSITRKEAEAYIEQYFRTYPGIKAYLDGCVKDANENGWSVTMFGRRRPIPELKSSNFMQRSFGQRVAMNAPIQGTAADIIKIAMIRVHDRLLAENLSSRLILQVHDELMVETAADEVETVTKILREEMMGAAKMAVPLEIDLNVGGSWYEAH